MKIPLDGHHARVHDKSMENKNTNDCEDLCCCLDCMGVTTPKRKALSNGLIDIADRLANPYDDCKLSVETFVFYSLKLAHTPGPLAAEIAKG